ncbi:MAG: hypothetical protein ACRDKT_06915 [Actinomycetota bacterium]
MRKFLSTMLATGLLVALVGGANAKPSLMWEDASGDAGNQDAYAPGAAETGFDITGGTIEKKGNALVFTVTHSAMPASKTLPEGFRFLWHFDVGKKQYRFTVKSFDIGKPDVVAQTGQERVGQVYADGVYRLEEGYVDATLPLQLSQFKVLEYLDGTWDIEAKTVSWTLPLSALKLKKGSVLNPGTGGSTGTGCQICWIPHYAERSLTPHTIIDSAFQSKPYKIP